MNTGWIGGAYGVGKRISMGYTRAMLNAALSGKLQKVEYYTDPIFGFQVPKSCDGLPANMLNPASPWQDQNVYSRRSRGLASRLLDNFKKFESGKPPPLLKAGPKV